LLPAETRVQEIACKAQDGCTSYGTLYRTTDCDVLAVLIHPRADTRRHYLIPALLQRGIAVWAHATRFTDSDSLLIDELFRDVSAVLMAATELGFRKLVAIGNSSGGAALAAYQAHVQSTKHASRSGDRPAFSGMVYLASMLNHSSVLSRVIDPAVTNEHDVNDRDRTLDMFDPANGFRPLPQSSRYESDFLRRYRAAQQARVTRIDAEAQRLCEEWNRELRAVGVTRLSVLPLTEQTRIEERTGLPKHLHIRCTEANPAYTDLSIEPNRRIVGSFFSPRPDLSNFSTFGFAQTVTPFAWLSTWSSTYGYPAATETVSTLHEPTLVLTYSGDHIVFERDGRAVFEACAATDKTRLEIDGDHLGLCPTRPEDRTAQVTAGTTIANWILHRFC